MEINTEFLKIYKKLFDETFASKIDINQKELFTSTLKLNAFIENQNNPKSYIKDRLLIINDSINSIISYYYVNNSDNKGMNIKEILPNINDVSTVKPPLIQINIEDKFDTIKKSFLFKYNER